MNNNKRYSRPLLYKVNVTWTSSEEVIMNYLNSYEKKTFIFTQKQLSLVTHTSEATISRFCKKLGFDTYKSFVFYFNQILLEFNQQYLIDYKNNQNNISDLLSKNIFAIKKTLNYDTNQKIEQASILIAKSKKIIVFGVDFSEWIASELATNLLKIGLNVFWNYDLKKILSAIAVGKSEDLHIIFSNESYHKEIFFMIEEIKRSEGKSILITSKDLKFNKSDIDVKIEYETIKDEKEAIPIISKISQMIIADTLFETTLSKKQLFQTNLLKTNATIKRSKNI